MIRFLFTLSVLLCISVASAFGQQKFSVSGRVVSANGQSIDMATVALHRLPDSVLLRTTLTDSAGGFVLTGVPAGNVYISIFADGYAVNTTNLPDVTTHDVVLPPVALTPLNASLKEVAVTARKALIVRKTDRTVVNVDALISAAGGTALDVLDRSPGVQTDQDGNVSMRGRQGVAIYVDDRPVMMSGNDLANYLRSLPASVIDQVELMTNPPAGYDAAGNAGIINIRLKKNEIKGFNGGINITGNRGQLTRSNSSINLNYRKNKLAAWANISGVIQDDFSNLDLYRTYKNADNTPQSYFEQNTYFRHKGNVASAKAGIDYYSTDKSTLGIILSASRRDAFSSNDNVADLYDNLRVPDSVIVAHNEDRVRFENAGLSLNYRRKMSGDAKLTVDADYLRYQTHTRQENRSTGYLPPRIFQAEDTLRGTLPTGINIYSLKVDYTHPNVLGYTFSAGAKSSLTNTDNLADYVLYAPGTVTNDYDKSNHFLYQEQISAAYVNFSKEYRYLSVQAGLRGEHTLSDGHQLGNVRKPDSSFRRTYTNLFPTFFFNYKTDSAGTHVIGLNYGRRIDRPYYQDLNPYISPMDKFTYYTGNPFLRPAFNQSVQLSHTYRNRLSTILSYSRSKDDVNETIQIKDGIYYSMSGNIGYKTSVTLGVDADWDPVKWLNLHAYAELGNITSRGTFYTTSIHTSGTYGFIMGSARATVPGGWTIELNGNYRSRIWDAQFVILDLWQTNMAVQKKLSKKATLKVAFNDMFYSRKIRGTIGSLATADAGWVNRNDSRNVGITFSYRFGKTIAGQEKYEAKGAEAEKNRVKG